VVRRLCASRNDVFSTSVFDVAIDLSVAGKLKQIPCSLVSLGCQS
jgi:hypothetical protein